MSDLTVWRTDSKIRWTFVEGPSVSACLVQMARLIDDFALEMSITDIRLTLDDDARVTLGVLTEER